MKLVLISDNHTKTSELNHLLPEGDVLVHSGDFSYKGTLPEMVKQMRWLESLKDRYKHIVFCLGNHDFLGEKNYDLMRSLVPEGVHYLQDSGIILDGIRFWGSPQSPFFYDWAFNRRGSEIAQYWQRIPDDVNVLITHTPPYATLDLVDEGTRHAGCPFLRHEIRRLKNLKLHVFGHLHYCGCTTEEKDGILYANAAILDDQYKRHARKVLTVEL